MSLTAAQVEEASKAIVNVGVARNAARKAAADALGAVDSTIHSENIGTAVAFLSAKFDEWAYGTSGLNQVAYGSRTLASWLDEGDELARQFARWGNLAQYTTARGLAEVWSNSFLDDLGAELGKLGTATKWVLGGAAVLVGLYLAVRLTGGTADLVKAVRG